MKRTKYYVMNGVVATHVADLRCFVCGKPRSVDASATLGPHKVSRLKAMVHLGCTPGAKPEEAKAWKAWLKIMVEAIEPLRRAPLSEVEQMHRAAERAHRAEQKSRAAKRARRGK